VPIDIERRLFKRENQERDQGGRERDNDDRKSKYIVRGDGRSFFFSTRRTEIDEGQQGWD